jgi:hypothetical protein
MPIKNPRRDTTGMTEVEATAYQIPADDVADAVGGFLMRFTDFHADPPPKDPNWVYAAIADLIRARLPRINKPLVLRFGPADFPTGQLVLQGDGMVAEIIRWPLGQVSLNAAGLELPWEADAPRLVTITPEHLMVGIVPIWSPTPGI